MKRCFGSPDREWLHPENFNDEPIYCEAPQNPDDIIRHGSDDEAYESPTDRRVRCEIQAQRFLEGKPVVLLSASLRGPFDSKSGWVNPWRSKSASRATSSQKKHHRVSKRATDNIASSAIFDPTSLQQHTPESRAALPQNTHDLPRYLDGEVFQRVRHWRDTVVAESDIPTSSLQHASQREPASADSRRATQQTDRRQSGLSLDTLDDEPVSTESCASSVANVEELRGSGVSSRQCARLPSLSAKPKPSGGSSQATVSQNCPSSGVLPGPTNTHQLETAHLSSRPVEIYEQLVLPVPEDCGPATNQVATETTASENSPAGEPHLRTLAVNDMDERNATPGSAVPEAAVVSALLKVPASARTDGSFRYRRKDGRGNVLAARRSKLAGPPTKPSDTAERPSSGGRKSPETGSEVDEAPEPNDVNNIPDVPTDIVPGAAQEVDSVPVAIQGQETPEEAPQPETRRSSQEPQEETAGQTQSEDNDSVESASQIDGPTLVPSASPSESELPSMPSFGHFSCDKYSQDMIPDAFDLPRKLLWPVSRRSAGSTGLQPVFGLELTRTPVSTLPEPVQFRRSGSSSHSAPSEHVSQPEGTDASQEPTEERVEGPPEGPPEGSGEAPEEAPAEAPEEVPEKVQPTIQVEQSMASETVEDHAQPAPIITTGSETASEAEDEGAHATEEPHVKSQDSAGLEDGAEAHLEPTPTRPVPDVQTPWAPRDAAILPPPTSLSSQSPRQNDIIEMPKPTSSPPKAAQSPWTGETNVVPGVSGTPAQLPSPHTAGAELPSMAIQALEQGVSQSPWARGDSQMRLPDVRLFNPLSSPANSHVLPTADPVSQPQIPRDEDIDMCDSQLYPPHPSTPETKRSGLPTPEFTLSVKSFKNFMTPSPQPAAKRRRISTEHLSSTQALVDAAISNPWTRPSSTNPKTQKRTQNQQPSQPKKRVSWAPLPHEDESTPDMPAASSPYGAELPARHPTLRATSPPPSILSTSKLPTLTQKFGRHFAAVASRRVGTTPLRQLNPAKRRLAGASLLPSASQQVCGSPPVGGMAEAFLMVDATTAAVAAGAGAREEVVQGGGFDGGEGVRVDMSWVAGPDHRDGDQGQGVLGESCGGEGMEGVVVEEGMMSGLVMDVDVGGGDTQEDDGGEMMQEDEATQETQGDAMPVDEVSAVMENLDDFLGGNWDLDAELAKQARESRGFDTSMASHGTGLMDVGVWD